VTPPITVVLFDLFGTLVLFDAARLPRYDSGRGPAPSTLPLLLPVLAEVAPTIDCTAFARTVQRVTQEMAEQRRRDAVEWPSRERFRRVLLACGGDRASIDTAAVQLSRCHLAALGAATIFPPAHAATLVAVRRRFRVGIVTNFDDTHTVYQVLQRHGLLLRGEPVVVSDAIGLRKPRPEVFEVALRELDVPPTEACFVGDTYDEDVLGARAAGVCPVWLTDPAAAARADPTVCTIATLPELIPLLGA
jgi:FMN phosphatase YigB (HAD superfamily)